MTTSDKATGGHDLDEAAALAQAIAHSAELVAEVEERNEELHRANANLAAANARAAELVAELQQQREELEWSTASLRQAGESQKRLLGVIAHDLRGGLGAVQSLVDSVASAPEAQPVLRQIDREAGRLVRLLEDLLGDADNRSGALILRPQTIALERLITDCRDAHHSAAQRKEQRIEVSCVPAEIRLDADPVRLRQALDNLISNAVKFTPRGGRIDLLAVESRGDVELAVLDNGPGLTDADLAAVFGEFQRLSARPTGGESSHGLGLAIVQQIAGAHGGHARAANRPGQRGARFTIQLPAPVVPGLSLRVLVVDDDPTASRLLGAQLRRIGHRSELCHDGAAAVSQVLSAGPGHYDLVLMDLEMPCLSGLEACEAIRTGGRTAEQLPIVAVTGHADGEHASQSFDAGMNDVVLKPLRNAGLRCLLRRWGRPAGED